MRKTLQILLGIILGFIPCMANATSVSITAITDTDGTTWTNGTIDWQLYNPSHTQLPVICKTGQPVNANFTWNFTTGTTSGSVPGNDTICPANTRWIATVNPNATSGSVSITLNISGSTQDVSSYFTGITAPRFSGDHTYGYSTSEVLNPATASTFYLVSNNSTAYWTGTVWQAPSNYANVIEGSIYPNLAAAISAAGIGGTIHLSSIYTTSISSEITLSNPITFKCDPGATITRNTPSATPIFNVTGNDVIFDGCTINANSVPQSTGGGSIEVTGSGFKFINGKLLNSSDYGIRLDGTVDATISKNHFTANAGGQAFEAFGSLTQATSGLIITGNTFVGAGGAIQSPSTGGNTDSFVFSNNQGTINLAGDTLLTVQDASTGHNAPINSGVISGNSCTLMGATSGAAPFGCYSLVANFHNCAVTGNTMYAVGQYVQTAMAEIGASNCTISDNTILAGQDPGSQGYDGFIVYSGNNTFSGNNIIGWGATGKGLFIYAQTGGADNTSISGGSIVANGTATSEDGISIACNISGSSAKNISIGGGISISGGAANLLSEAINFAGLTSDCLASGTVNDVSIAYSTYGVYANATFTTLYLGQLTLSNVTTPFTGSISQVSFPKGISGNVTGNVTGNLFLAHGQLVIDEGSGNLFLVGGTSSGVNFCYNGSASTCGGSMDASGNFTLNHFVYVNAGNKILYECATGGALPTGALTTTAASCGTTTDTGLRVP